MSRDARRVKEFQDAYALVPLLHIIAVHILIGLDRITDPLGKVRLTQALPFLGKLRAFGRNGHKVRREGIHPSPGFGADDPFRRDLFDPEIAALEYLLRGDDIIQHRQARRASPGHAGTVFPLPQLLRVFVGLFSHCLLPNAAQRSQTGPLCL